jgi:DNA-binding NarL/FixJ family response regulator
MPPTFSDEGLRAALVVRKRWPAVGVLVLSQYAEERYAAELLAVRASGGVEYLLKDRVAEVAELVDTLQRVARGGSAIDPEVVAQLLTRKAGPLFPADTTRARSARSDGGGPLQHRHRRCARRRAWRGGEARQLDLHEARPGAHGHRPPPGLTYLGL